MPPKIKFFLSKVDKKNFADAIKKDLELHSIDTMKKVASSIGLRIFIKQQIRFYLYSSNEYDSLVSGDLRSLLGVVDAMAAVEQIIDKIVDKLDIRVFKKTMKVSLLKDDLAEIYAAPLASYTSENGFTVEWVKMMTQAGFDIIPGYFYIESPLSVQYSRTGTGIMKKDKKTYFSLPRQYAGDLKDNWFTRSLQPLSEDIANYIGKEYERLW